jgi:hypothetical protein
MILMTVHGRDGSPSLADAARELGVSVSEMDGKFGVVPINPSQHLYAVQVRRNSLPAGTPSDKPYAGPYSNPKIAPFGPIKND